MKLGLVSISVLSFFLLLSVSFVADTAHFYRSCVSIVCMCCIFCVMRNIIVSFVKLAFVSVVGIAMILLAWGFAS